MNPAIPSPGKRRRIWPWVVGICLSPFVAIGVAAVSYLTLDHDARILRREVMAASDSSWHTKMQFSAGGMTVGLARCIVACVHNQHTDDARLALAAVKGASVGIYELNGEPTDWSREKLFARTDEVMNRRGWTRTVGVADAKDTVLVYTSNPSDASDRIDVCLAVVDGTKLVIASTSVDASKLSELVERHCGEELRRKLHVSDF